MVIHDRVDVVETNCGSTLFAGRAARSTTCTVKPPLSPASSILGSTAPNVECHGLVR